MIRIAINGLGRIGRAFLKRAVESNELQIVAINDLADIDSLIYLLKYDSVYGASNLDIEKIAGGIKINGNKISVLSDPDPEKLPWGEMDIDVVLEATGVFASYEKAEAHIKAGAKRVVVSAPIKDSPRSGVVGATVLMGVNEDKLKTCDISSNASCTTNAGSPLIAILDEALGIEKAILSTVHGYTASQSIVDAPHKKDSRRGRAAAVNIVPSSTGSAIATTKAYTALENKFDGIALRVPVSSGSIVDITFVAGRKTDAKEVNEILVKASRSARWSNIFAVTDEPLVSTDILGSRFASIADLSMTRVVDGNLVKVLSWYDNETGYTEMLFKHIIETGKYAR